MFIFVLGMCMCFSIFRQFKNCVSKNNYRVHGHKTSNSTKQCVGKGMSPSTSDPRPSPRGSHGFLCIVPEQLYTCRRLSICKLIYTSRSINIVYSIGCVPRAWFFFHVAIHLGAHSISEHMALSRSFWQLRNSLCFGGNARFYLSSAFLMGCFQSFVTMNRASVTISAGDLFGYVDKFWCRWNSWRRNDWVKGFVQKVPKNKWRKVSHRGRSW